ncbi:acetoin reductase [Leuconostoc falkenbergense]|uniref:acetoin reductase n=1 Tax=Leuconostoc falkenbergense TaxID=2766470 RepID=UPI0021A97D7B|nr:acetoin reductase [Leuconostoc falkenbergense]MCT4378258.1 acetoin reductase [Leuconostoc falkenbergense]MDV8951682.1 acetoin reductase [Leuconostoc falkenbergense]
MTQKVAIITGAGRGIGKAIAEHLAAENYFVAVADIDGVTANYVSERLNAIFPQVSRHYVLDVAEREAVFNLVDNVVADFGRLDVFINNAGIAYINNLVDSDPDKVERLFDVNLKGTFWGIQAAAKQFIKQGDGGRIVNAASLAAVEGSALQGAYSASKFAIRGLGQSAAKELAQYGITVNAYDPGIVLTPLRDYIDQRTAQIKNTTPTDQRQSVIDEIALGRPAKLDEIADLVSFLVSNKAKYITGQSILIDGGMRFH